jgi:hypothetical protein
MDRYGPSCTNMNETKTETMAARIFLGTGALRAGSVLSQDGLRSD